ncbi:hypothetical protein GOP47_0015961 [Adiantum capillus-veneris]|uniref:Endoglucanase n=1 Tax=Adiantum capillus-veneris TaxID=13818 RepID=A0A9D4UKP1_ADICA|nr:hypothetical protein GOP47_0015961 [Adiantum capillus-veneris]
MATSSFSRRCACCAVFFFFIQLAARPSSFAAAASFNYADALQKSLLFFEAQRSGKLPSNQRVWWRGDSGLSDGKTEGVDLQGGYYDAGDHVKYGFPMAYSMTMLAWGIIQYNQALSANNQLGYALDALRWGTDYFIKAHPEPNVLWAEVGDGDSDHNCWQRSEDMTTPRQAYRLDASHPGSDQAGETAAAMAAASLAFKNQNPAYSSTLLQHARQLFTFSDTYKGKYDDSIYNVKAFYQSVSGYNDELLWAAIWLYQATGEQTYLDYVAKNAYSMGGTGWNMKELSWDVKFAGVQILVSKLLFEGKAYRADAGALQQYQRGAEFYLCYLLRKNAGDNNAQITPGGLLFTRRWNNMQYVTSASFSLSVYSDYLSAAGKQLQCPSGTVSPSELLSLAQSQIDYILGKNPLGMSYMVGYGANYPKHVHHRGASIVSYKKNPSFVTCKGGYDTWYGSGAADPNVLVGALVGGPGAGDQYSDDRKNYEQSEPTTSTNGPLVGILARLAGGRPPPQQPGRRYRTPPRRPAPRRPYTRPIPKKVPARRHYTPSRKPSYKPRARYIRKRIARPSSRPLGTSSLKYNAGKASANVAFQQVLTSSWTQSNKIYRRYLVKVTNVSRGKLSNIKLASRGLTGAVYGIYKLSASSNLYTFPQSLAPRQSAMFVYIQPGPQATFTLASFTPTF